VFDEKRFPEDLAANMNIPSTSDRSRAPGNGDTPIEVLPAEIATRLIVRHEAI